MKYPLNDVEIKLIERMINCTISDLKVEPSNNTKMVNDLREIKRKHNIDVDKITEEQFNELFSALNQEKIPKNVVTNILIDFASEKFISIDKYAGVSDKEIEQEIKKILDKKPGLSIGAYMGLVMQKFKGKIDGKKAMALIKKLIK